MAGAIAEIARHTLVKDFRRIDPSTARIILVEAGPRILPAMPENLSDYASQALTRMGVEVMTVHARDQMRCRRRRSGTGPHRFPHHHLGRRRGGLARRDSGSTRRMTAPAA